ncbi:MAG: restriction endonuclease subunit S [Beijerinckiaceae bacterium]
MTDDTRERLKKYGVESLPGQWRISKVKYIASYLNGYPFKPDDWAPEGVPIVRIQDLTNTDNQPNFYNGTAPERYLLKDGDILISWSASLGVFVWQRGPAWLNQHIFKVSVDTSILERAYFPWVATWFIEQLKNYVHGSTMQHLTADAFGSFPVPIPPAEDQRRVEAFLQCETKQIDALIDAKQRLLNLLAEKRRAIVAEAVMRGLAVDAALRPSGIDWLGDIPAHWEIERARWLFTERDQRSETGEEEMLTVSHLTGVTPRSEKDVNMFEAESTAGYKLCFAGDLAINTLWAWMGAMGSARVDGIVSPAYNVYTPSPSLLPDYVDALVRIPVFAKEVTRYSKGVWSSRLRLYPEGFFETWWPVPPLDEQREIIRHIATQTSKIDRLRAATEHSITLLKERRGALIAAAVTGQIDITEAA